MRKISLILFVVVLAISLVSCKSNKKEKPSSEKQTKTETFAYNVSNSKHKVEWTGYKTTGKAPVKGTFKKVNIIANGTGNTAKEAINNLEFSIPISSIWSGDSGRDYKLKKFYFDIMENTKLLSGKIVLIDDSKGYTEIVMNGITKQLPFNYSLENDSFNFTTSMDVLNWNAQASVDSLNEACKELHKGTDGITKTWSEVGIEVSIVF